MGKLVFRHGNNEFHFQFGIHTEQPGDREKLEERDLDALVLEQNLLQYPQAKQVAWKMLSAGKPVYYVESPAAYGRAVRFMRIEMGVNKWGRRVAWATFLAGGAAIAGAAASGSRDSRKGVKQSGKLTRRLLLGGLGLTLLSGGLKLALPLDFSHTRVQADAGPLENRLYTREELDRLPLDSEHGEVISGRNAIIAEALLKLEGEHQRIGVVVGAGHYNLPHYLEDDGLRGRELGGNRPEFVRYLKKS